ncbi:MAG: type II toxin-antitoxin system mRNA interferase toxin, RelE/StbE family [Pyrinomonadaceae bacterium]
MPEILFHPSFKRAYKRAVATGSDRENRFHRALEIFAVDPFDSKLRTHKLKGKLNEYWSFSVEYDLRVVFFFEKDGSAVLFDIGSHDEVY